MILWWLLRGRQIVIIGTCIFSRTLAVGLAASAYAGKAHSWIFFFFLSLSLACRIPRSGIEPGPLAVKVWCPNYYTARKFLESRFLNLTPKLLNQKLWGWSPGICLVMCSLCDSYACSCLRSTAWRVHCSKKRPWGKVMRYVVHSCTQIPFILASVTCLLIFKVLQVMYDISSFFIPGGHISGIIPCNTWMKQG